MKNPIRRHFINSITNAAGELPRGPSHKNYPDGEYDSAYRGIGTVDLERIENNGLGRCATNVSLSADSTGDSARRVAYRQALVNAEGITMTPFEVYDGLIDDMPILQLSRAASIARSMSKNLQEAA